MPMRRCRRGSRSSATTGRRPWSFRLRREPMPILGKSIRKSEAVNAFARAIGAARSGDAAASKEQQQRLLALRDAAKEAKLGYWVEQIDIQADIAGSLALCAEGKSEVCIEEMRKAAAREDATEKHVVTPGPIIPARELLADLLLASGKAGDGAAGVRGGPE